MAQVALRPELPRELAAITLIDADDNPYPLAELWSERPVVLIHLRHFGCILCRHYAGALRDFYGDFEASGARLVAVGTGGRQYARDFVAERQIPYLVLVDKAMASHEVLRVEEGPWWGIFRPRVVGAALRARISGARQGKTGPNPFKYGAAHVIGPGDVLHYAWLNADYHDNAPVDELLEAALDAARATPAGGALRAEPAAAS